MSRAQQLPMTPEEHLAWEEGQELKWEFDGFQPIARVGGTFGHSRIQANVMLALGNSLRDEKCQPCGSDMRVPTAPGHWRHSDAVVTCTPPLLNTRDLTDPVVVFEVLSPSTAEDDRTVKLAEYQALPSLRRYVMLEQNRVFATVITRSATDWDLFLAGSEGMLAMPKIGIEVPVAEFYEGLNLAQHG